MTNTPAAEEIKEVQMDVPLQEGGGGKTRRRRRARRSKTQRGGAAEEGETVQLHDVAVEKAGMTITPVVAAAPAPAAAPTPVQKGAAHKPTVAKQLATKPAAKPAAAPTVILTPAKKLRLTLVSKKAGGTSAPAATATKAAVAKTFKAKRIRVTIDNTARTQKRRRQVLRSIDSLTEEQLREQAVKFGLSRADSVKKVPQDLLRKMLKDYYAMRKGFL